MGVDGLIALNLLVLITAVALSGAHLSETVFLGCGFLLSVCCGFQFPLASRGKNNHNETVAGAFSADLMGAAMGIILTSLVLIPLTGIYGAIFFLILVKLTSMVTAARGL